MKKGFLALTFIFIASLLPANSATPIKSGSMCTKQGATRIYKGKLYTCTKSGKRLSWNGGVIIKTQTSTVNPLPSTMPTPTLTPSPITSSISPVAPTPSPTSSPTPSSSSNLSRFEYERIKKLAYENIRNAAENGDSANVELNYFIGDDFPLALKNLYIRQVEYSSKLVGSFFSKRERVNIYMYTEKDALAVKNDVAIGHNYAEFERWFKDWQNGNLLEHSIGIAAFYVDKGNGFQGYAGVALNSASSPTSLRKYSIQVVPHEYFHIVQDYFIASQRSIKFPDQDSYDKYFPPIFREGSTNTISFALSCDTFEKYLDLYSDFIQEKRAQTSSVPLFGNLKTQDEIVRTLKSMESRTKNSYAHEASYSIGQLLFEWVIAEYGFSGYRRMIINQLIGTDFEDNVRASLGISLSELYEKAAPHILEGFRNQT